MKHPRQRRRVLHFLLGVVMAAVLSPAASAATVNFGTDLSRPQQVGSGQLIGPSVHMFGGTSPSTPLEAPVSGTLEEVRFKYQVNTNLTNVKVRLWQTRFAGGSAFRLVKLLATRSYDATGSTSVTDHVPVSAAVQAGDRIGYEPFERTRIASPTNECCFYPSTAGDAGGVGSFGGTSSGCCSEGFTGNVILQSSETPMLAGTIDTPAAPPAGPTSPPTPVPAPPVVRRPGARLQGSATAVVSHGKVGFVLKCEASWFVDPCVGSVALKAQKPVGSSKLPKTLGSAKFNVARGKARRVKMKLKKAARKKARKRALRAYLVITMNGPDGKPLRSSKRVKLKPRR